MNIAVLCGGISPEREVSLSSGRRVSEALRSRGHAVACLDLSCDLPDVPSFTEGSAALSLGTDRPVGRGVLSVCRRADMTFLALHGGIGENGRLQAVLDCYGVRYTGAGYLPSLLAMDKGITRTLLAAGGVPVARGMTLTKNDDPRLVKRIGFPLVVKPCSCGSSVGISMVEREERLGDALAAAFAFEDRVVVEERLVGRELTVGILRGKALPAVEIRPKTGFYDYENKYLPDRTVELCPAPLTAEEAALLAKSARRAAALLQIDRYCRVDFILSEGVPYCLEINTLPGMTPTSLLPQEAAAVHLSYADLCLAIIEEALQG